MPTQSRTRRPLKLFLWLCMAAVASPVLAQNVSETVQSGTENSATTVQEGRNFSVTFQQGMQNIATVEQTGRHNLSALSQSGEGHEMTVTQTGDLSIHSSTQGSTRLGPVSRSHSGNAGGITTRFEFHFD